MIYVVRIIFFGIIFMISLLIIKKSKVINKRRWYGISFIVVFLLYSLSCWLPVENAFVIFPSPEAAFRYTNSGDVNLVVEGEESALVVGNDDNDVYDIIPKSGTGWELSLAGDFKTVITNISLNGVVYWVYQYRNSDDYYIEVNNPSEGTAGVTDNRNSEFFYLTDNINTLDITYYNYYAYVHDLDDDYTLIVNGEVIPVLDEQN